MITHRAAIWLLVFSLAGCTPRGASAPYSPADDTAAALHTLLTGAEAFGFSGAVLAARGGEIIFAGGYGMADRDGGVRITPGTALYLGSVTKQFTAAAILELEERGTLSVSDPIGRFLADVPADKQGITLHQLLSHTSGLDFSANQDIAIGRDSLIRNAMSSELAFPPGEGWGYSNGAYSLLAAIVELASGRPYEEYLREHVLLPAGMRRTGYVLPRWAEGEVAHGYRRGNDTGRPMEAPGWTAAGPSWNLMGSGGLISTVEDMHRWHVALESGAVLSAASVRKMTAQHAPLPPNPFGWHGYGYGWIQAKTPDGRPLVFHNGSNGIFFADFRRYVADDMALVILTNTQDEGNFSDEDILQMFISQLEAVLFGARPDEPPSIAGSAPGGALGTHAGIYRFPSGAEVEVRVERGGLRVEAAGQEAVDLMAGAAAADWPVDEMNARVESIFAALPRVNLEPLLDVAPEAAAERLQRILLRTVESGVERNGAYRGHQVLGTVPVWWSLEEEWTTFVRLDFERGSRITRLHWDDPGRVSGVGGAAIPAPVTLLFLPQTATRFATYHPTMAARPTLEFGTGPHGNAHVRIRLGTQEGVARRVVASLR
jgi:CubicO group peptidase (beta-lactamase class C family)